MKKPVTIILVVTGFLLVTLIAISAGVSLFLGEAPVVVSDKVALVEIEGVILDSEDVVSQLKEYSKNSSVKAIVLRINSPGGAVVPSQEIYDEVLRIRREDKQKVVTSMGTVAASGGYYIASASDRIMANPGSLTGSIGVIMEFVTVEQLMDKLGVKSEVIKSGKRKDAGNFMRGMTEEERAYLQSVIDDVHSQFVEAVATGRKMSVEAVWPLADGSVFTGRQAVELGLVDDIGTLEDAIRLAGELGNISGEPKVLRHKEKFTFMDLLKGEEMGNLLRKGLGSRLPSLYYLSSAAGLS